MMNNETLLRDLHGVKDGLRSLTGDLETMIEGIRSTRYLVDLAVYKVENLADGDERQRALLRDAWDRLFEVWEALEVEAHDQTDDVCLILDDLQTVGEFTNDEIREELTRVTGKEPPDVGE